MATFKLNDDGTWSAAIAGAGDAADVRDYRVRPAAAGLGLFACVVERLDTGHAYRVSLERGGAWRCPCPDALYRPGREGGCKHKRFARAFHAFLRSLRSMTHDSAHAR